MSSELAFEDLAIALLGLLGHARVVDSRLETTLTVSRTHLGRLGGGSGYRSSGVQKWNGLQMDGEMATKHLMWQRFN